MSSQRAWWHLCLTKLENRAILLALAMKDKSMEAVKGLKEVIQMCQVW